MNLNEIKQLPTKAEWGSWTKFPRTSAVYFVFDCGELVYIGQARNLWNRIQQHRRGWDKKATKIYWLPTPVRKLLQVECDHIAQLRPKLNKLGVQPLTRDFTCLRCGYTWNRRSQLATSLPRQCPYCKSPKWNVERAA